MQLVHSDFWMQSKRASFITKSNSIRRPHQNCLEKWLKLLSLKQRLSILDLLMPVPSCMPTGLSSTTVRLTTCLLAMESSSITRVQDEEKTLSRERSPDRLRKYHLVSWSVYSWEI
uniref:Uncharacterized protein n=1 Tax=Cacopsylla melanoneura TaxID=428564 RepID=A0A8D8LRW2_9HEMI